MFTEIEEQVDLIRRLTTERASLLDNFQKNFALVSSVHF